jgi:amino-acid N-acetyltransferase
LAIDPTEVQIITAPSPHDEGNTLVGFEDGEHVNVDDAINSYHTNDEKGKNVASSLAPDLLRQLPFVGMFRGSANYIANHRGTLAVYHIPGGLLDKDYYTNSPPPPPADVEKNGKKKKKKKSNTQNVVFRDLMNDIALTWLLGMKIVLVVGCRHQIEKRLAAKKAAAGYDSCSDDDEINNSHLTGMENDRSHGLRVTDEDMLRIVKEEAGYVRFEVERQLARSLRMQGSNGGKSPGGGGGNNNDGYFTDGNVVSGNFYSAQPFGILNGIDYK